MVGGDARSAGDRSAEVLGAQGRAEAGADQGPVPVDGLLGPPHGSEMLEPVVQQGRHRAGAAAQVLVGGHGRQAGSSASAWRSGPRKVRLTWWYWPVRGSLPVRTRNSYTPGRRFTEVPPLGLGVSLSSVVRDY